MPELTHGFDSLGCPGGMCSRRLCSHDHPLSARKLDQFSRYSRWILHKPDRSRAMRMMFDLDLLKTCSLLPNVRFPPTADVHVLAGAGAYATGPVPLRTGPASIRNMRVQLGRVHGLHRQRCTGRSWSLLDSSSGGTLP
jgi:hypothetical protein